MATESYLQIAGDADQIESVSTYLGLEEDAEWDQIALCLADLWQASDRGGRGYGDTCNVIPGEKPGTMDHGIQVGDRKLTLYWDASYPALSIGALLAHRYPKVEIDYTFKVPGARGAIGRMRFKGGSPIDFWYVVDGAVQGQILSFVESQVGALTEAGQSIPCGRGSLECTAIGEMREHPNLERAEGIYDVPGPGVTGAVCTREYTKTVEVMADGYDGFTLDFHYFFVGDRWEIGDFDYRDCYGNKRLSHHTELTSLHQALVPQAFALAEYRQAFGLDGSEPVGKQD